MLPSRPEPPEPTSPRNGMTSDGQQRCTQNLLARRQPARSPAKERRK
jgi:hypothetical protein